MMCLVCRSESKVLDTRGTTRTRQCKACGARWKTQESVIEGSVREPCVPKKRAKRQVAKRVARKVEQPANWLFGIN